MRTLSWRQRLLQAQVLDVHIGDRWQRNDDRGRRRLDATGSTQEVNAGAAAEAGAATAAGAAGAAAEGSISEVEQSAAPARSPSPASPPPGLARALAPAAGRLEQDATGN